MRSTSQAQRQPDRKSRSCRRALFGFVSRTDDPPQLDGPCVEHLALPRYPCFKGKAIGLVTTGQSFPFSSLLDWWSRQSAMSPPGSRRYSLIVAAALGSIALMLGGIVSFGSNVSTLRQTEAAIGKAEALRSELIGGIDLRIVRDAPVKLM